MVSSFHFVVLIPQIGDFILLESNVFLAVDMSFSHIPFIISPLVFLVTFCNLSEFHPVDK